MFISRDGYSGVQGGRIQGCARGDGYRGVQVGQIQGCARGDGYSGVQGGRIQGCARGDGYSGGCAKVALSHLWILVKFAFYDRFWALFI